ncbi:hypothetical protein HNP84_000349 [Thermocatellispora tengchongensis]|uniref:Uncharacterized protein n=1 Tax=Thermocatellispora tengchongensis TaxID=1073253 RepID=A0A840NYC3_9ACTN|nr:hypothetical protein [Thermocatellispora tengchongensis]
MNFWAFLIDELPSMLMTMLTMLTVFGCLVAWSLWRTRRRR